MNKKTAELSPHCLESRKPSIVSNGDFFRLFYGDVMRKEFSTKKKKDVFLIFKGKCFDCGFLSIGGGFVKHEKPRISTRRGSFYLGGLEIHHVITVKNGGTNELNNLILLCKNCHKKRHGVNK